MLELMVTRIAYGANGIHVFNLEAPDRSPLPAAEPGAHIGLHLPSGMVRQYSLLHPDPAPRSYVIGVKRDREGGGSAWIHDHLRVGQRLPVDPPRNNFPLILDGSPSVLIAGGIGITPIYAMARHLGDTGLDYSLHYSCRTGADMMFGEELSAIPTAHLHLDDTAGCLMSLAAIVEAAPDDAHLYCCGPLPMLTAFEGEAAKRFAADRIHVEKFTNDTAAVDCDGLLVRLHRSQREIRIAEGQTILEAVLAAGIAADHSCEQGICGACEVRVIDGIPDHRDAILSAEEKSRNTSMMICCSGSVSPVLVLDL